MGGQARRGAIYPGIMVLVLASLLGFGAYWLYKEGVPGSPEGVPNIMLQPSEVRIYIPQGSTSRIMAASEGLARESSNNLTLLLETWGTPLPDKALVIVEASGGAQPSELVPVGFKTFESREWPPPIVRASVVDGDMTAYLVELPVGNVEKLYYRGQIDLVGMVSPVWVRDNARTLLQIPKLTPAQLCPFLKDAESSPTEAWFQDWRSTRSQCVAPGDERKVRFQLRSKDVADLKLDFVSTPPTSPGLLVWESSGVLQVRANLISISAEATAQKRLFMAGVLAGLAGGLFPVGIDYLSRGLRRKGVVCENAHVWVDESNPPGRSEPIRRGQKATSARPTTPASLSSPDRPRSASAVAIVVMMVAVWQALRALRKGL